MTKSLDEGTSWPKRQKETVLGSRSERCHNSHESALLVGNHRMLLVLANAARRRALLV